MVIIRPARLYCCTMLSTAGIALICGRFLERVKQNKDRYAAL
jgi:hypothetical protein